MPIETFTPWTIADGRCTVAPESEWNAPRDGTVLIDCDLFAEWNGPMRSGAGDVLFYDTLRTAPWTDGRNHEPGAFSCLDVNQVRRRVLAMIDANPGVTWLVRTERPENLPAMVNDWDHTGILWSTPENLWPGVTIRTQADADRLIPQLLNIPAAKRWLDVVPGEKIDLTRYSVDGAYAPRIHTDIDLVRVRGESDPVHPDWVRTLQRQCQAAGVPFVFVTWGDWVPLFKFDEFHDASNRKCELAWLMNDGRCEFYSSDFADVPERGGQWLARVGRERSGRMLDGREWDEVAS